MPFLYGLQQRRSAAPIMPPPSSLSAAALVCGVHTTHLQLFCHCGRVRTAVCILDCWVPFLQVLQTAKADDRVRGLLAILGDRANFGGMAQLQELRNALLDFRVSFNQILRLTSEWLSARTSV